MKEAKRHITNFPHTNAIHAFTTILTTLIQSIFEYSPNHIPVDSLVSRISELVQSAPSSSGQTLRSDIICIIVDVIWTVDAGLEDVRLASKSLFSTEVDKAKVEGDRRRLADLVIGLLVSEQRPKLTSMDQLVSV